MGNTAPRTIHVLLILAFCVLFIAGIAAIFSAYQAYYFAKDFAGKASTQVNSSFFTANPIKEGYATGLSYFMIAIGVLFIALLLPRISTFNIGANGINVTLQSLQQQVNNLQDLSTVTHAQVNTLQDLSNTTQGISTGLGGGNKRILEKLPPEAGEMAEVTSQQNKEYPDDPQKGKWGGKSESNKRKMMAEVTPANFPGLYKVDIIVTNTVDGPPLTGIVKFHLHNTFLNPNPIIAVKDNKAILSLGMVYGAFTVGAQADEDGKTELELDLAELPNAPEDFKSR